MKFISDFNEGEQIIEHYLCKSKQTLKTRGGKSYYSLVLQDQSGTIDGKVWDLNNQIEDFDEHDYIKIEGLVISYQNSHQINIRKIRRSNVGEYDPKNYVPVSKHDIEEMFTELKGYIEKVNNPYIKQLLEGCFTEDEAFINKFKLHSAARNIHHNYMGGLLEHTLSVASVCDFMSAKYEGINYDALMAGAIFHDIGKLQELGELPFNEYTDEGQLLGHIMMGYDLISDKIRAIEGFPVKEANIIKHIILAHHGELEYGSPKVPQTIEAMLVHCADNMDAKLKCFEETIANDQNDGEWTNYHRMLQRSIFKATK